MIDPEADGWKGWLCFILFFCCFFAIVFDAFVLHNVPFNFNINISRMNTELAVKTFLRLRSVGTISDCGNLQKKFCYFCLRSIKRWARQIK